MLATRWPTFRKPRKVGHPLLLLCQRLRTKSPTQPEMCATRHYPSPDWAVTHVVELLNLVKDRIRVHECAPFLRRLAGCGRSLFSARHSPSGCKPPLILRQLRHEWNSCPSLTSRESEFFRSLLEKRGTSDGSCMFMKFEKGSRSISGTLINAKEAESSSVKRASCDRASRGNESIPIPRRRAKTAPEERSIWFPLLYLTCEKEADGPL